jgi:hypothetical protein
MARLSGPKAHGRASGLGNKSSKLIGTREDESGNVQTALSSVRDALKEKTIAAKEKAVKGLVQDFLKQNGMKHVDVQVKLDVDAKKAENYISSLLTTLSEQKDSLFKEGLTSINIVTGDIAKNEMANNTEFSKRLEYQETDNGTTAAEVVTSLNFDPNKRYPHDMHLNVYIPNEESKALPNLTGVMADYVMVKTGSRMMNLDINDPANSNPPRFLFLKTAVDVDTRAILKLLQDKSKNDPDFKKQMEFVKEWEKKSAFSIQTVKIMGGDGDPESGKNKPVEAKDWVFSADKIPIKQKGMEAREVIRAAFSLNEPSRGYVLNDAEKKAIVGASVSPSEELAEAVRVARDPQFPQHMERLAKENPDAKAYLEGLLSVVAKNDDVIKGRLQTVSKDPSALIYSTAKPKRNRAVSEELKDESVKKRVKRKNVIPI